MDGAANGFSARPESQGLPVGPAFAGAGPQALRDGLTPEYYESPTERATRGPGKLRPWSDAIRGRAFHHGDMSAASFTPARHGPPPGATALGGKHRRHLLGDALRAVKVFVGAAIDVVLLGEYGEEAGVRRRE